MIRVFLKNIWGISRRISFLIRKPFYKIRSNYFGRGVTISKSVYLRKSRIGNYSYIGPYSSLNCVNVGNYCSIASFVNIGEEEHSYKEPTMSEKLLEGAGNTETRTIIGNDVWIGAQCFIRMGVVIGNGAVIGANSFVNKDVPDYAIVAGSPARIIKYRFDKNKIEIIRDSQYWLKDIVDARETISYLKNSFNELDNKRREIE